MTDVDTNINLGKVVVGYSTNSTVKELIDGIRDLRGKPDDNKEKISLKKAIAYLLDNEKFDWEQAILLLKNLPGDETIAKIKETINPENNLGQKDIEELERLKKESENASAEKKQRIEETLKRLSKNAPSESEKYIKRIRENLRDLENITPNEERKIVEEIVKTENVSKEEAKEIFDKAVIDEAEVRVESFAKEVAEKYGTEEKVKNIIKVKIQEIVLGEETKIEGVPIGVIENKEINQITKSFIEKHPKVAQDYQLSKILEQFDVAVANAPTATEKQQVREYEKMVMDFYGVKSPNILANESRFEVETKMETVDHKTPGEIKTALFNVEAVVKGAYHTPEKFKNIVDTYQKIRSIKPGLLPNIPQVRAFENLMATATKNPVIVNMQRMAHTKIDLISFANKIPGVNKLVMGITETVGGLAMADFMLLSTQIMAEQGLLPGAVAIFNAITTGAGVLEGAAGVEGITVLSSTLAAWQSIPVVGQIILIIAAIIFTINNVLKPLYDKFNEWLHNLGINSGVKNFFADTLNLGNFVGSVAEFGFNIAIAGGAMIMGGLGFIFGPMLTMGLAAMTAIIAPVVIGLVAGAMAYNLLISQPMIASLVPPPPLAAGGTCQPKDITGTPVITNGTNNCNAKAPENNTGIDKTIFVDLANRWAAGTNYADQCFNDVVNRALCAGINPQYALWAWLHESGASNYDVTTNVEDFGIHGNSAVPPENFDKQINWFLKLDPGTACPSLGYWLSFATNYLTGECDPKKEIPQADGTMMTGEKYLLEIQDQWSWIKPGNLPADIHFSKGGKQCGSSSGAVATADNEYINSDGVLMVCSGPVDENGNFIGQPGSGNFDPNALGLVGEVVAGECSVSKSVVLTKQCGESWSSKGLPGGSGTICSAGCGPSSASSILRSQNGSLTPDSVIFESGSPYSNMTGDGSSLSQARDALKMHGFNNTEYMGTCTQKDIASWICEGKAVIILANSYTGNGGNYIGHILPIVAVKDGKLQSKDPYYSNQTPFVTEGGIKSGQIKDLLECLTVQLKAD